jgi:hypothetical protein
MSEQLGEFNPYLSFKNLSIVGQGGGNMKNEISKKQGPLI